MSNARLILVILICAAPAVLLFDGPIARALVAGAAVTGMLILLRTMRPGETTFLLSIARPAALLAAIPALWVLIQVLPLGVLAHPIWDSAAAATEQPILGAISIDIGASVMALGQYLTLVAIGLWSAAVGVDRRRAEWILFSLMAATGLIALTAVVTDVFGLTALGAGLSWRTQAIDCAAMGVVIAGAAAVRTLERYETRHANPDRSVAALMATFLACAVVFVICGAAVALGRRANVFVATGYGAAGVIAVVLIRRLGYGAWGIFAFVMPGIALAGFLVANNPTLGTRGFVLAFATDAPEPLIATSQRILADAPLWGVGAGAFEAIAPIYRDIDDRVSQSAAPTTAAAAAIELGLPLLWFIVLATLGAIVVLFRAALLRGRDSFYSTAGAASLLTLLFLCLINAGLLGTAAAMITAATAGLAFAQSKSRSVH